MVDKQLKERTELTHNRIGAEQRESILQAGLALQKAGVIPASVACRGDFKGQARGAYEAIKALVESQGGTMANVIKITTYMTDMRYRLDLASLREEFLGKKGPASTLIEISALAHPDWMIEIEAIAVL